LKNSTWFQSFVEICHCTVSDLKVVGHLCDSQNWSLGCEGLICCEVLVLGRFSEKKAQKGQPQPWRTVGGVRKWHRTAKEAELCADLHK
jgi:hypothetical protein